MSEEIELTVITTNDGSRRVFVDKLGDDEVWLNISLHGGSACCVMTFEQAIQLADAIKAKVAQ